MKFLKWTILCMAILYAGLCVYALIPQQTIPVQELAGKSSSFISVKGRTLHYEQAGKGKPLVLVHGFAGSTYTWRYLIPLMAPDFTVYALDLPGFGLSDKSPDADYDLRSQTTAVLDFIAALNLGQVAIAGHSMGGVVAGIAAAQAPGTIERAILIAAGFYHGRPPKFFDKLFFPLNVLMARSFYTRGARGRSLAHSYLNQAMITDDLIERYLLPSRTPHAADALARMMLTASGESYEGIAGSIAVPTLLIWARQDRNNPVSDGERLNGEIRNSRLIIIDQSGHMVQEEQPEKVADAIRNFLR